MRDELCAQCGEGHVMYFWVVKAFREGAEWEWKLWVCSNCWQILETMLDTAETMTRAIYRNGTAVHQVRLA